MKLEDIKKLHQKKFREELKHFVIEGEHLVQELEDLLRRIRAVQANPWR